MKLDQKEPGTWIGIGAVILIVGLILRAAEDTGGGVGRFLIGAGAVLVVVGLIALAVRIGGGSREG